MEKFTDWLNESKEEDKVQKYKKKPVTVEAIKWTGDNFEDVKSFAGKNVKIDGDDLIITTLEDGKDGKAVHAATIGDFVIKGVEGEFYFCKPTIFKKTYDKA